MQVRKKFWKKRRLLSSCISNLIIDKESYAPPGRFQLGKKEKAMKITNSDIQLVKSKDGGVTNSDMIELINNRVAKHTLQLKEEKPKYQILNWLIGDLMRLRDELLEK